MENLRGSKYLAYIQIGGNNVNVDKLIEKYYTKDDLNYIWHKSITPFGYRKIRDLATNIPKSMNFVVKKSKRDKVEQIIKKSAEAFRCKYANRVAEYARQIEEERQRKIEKAKNLRFCKKHCLGKWAPDSLIFALRVGENFDFNYEYNAETNGIDYIETYSRYSSGCKFWRTDRHFTLQIKNGYYVTCIGGLITYIKGNKINRERMPCEWVVQGRAISDIQLVKGYLVRGEHIQAKSLKEAQRINAEKRKKILSNTLAARAKLANIDNEIVTFEMSLKAGNCHAGTMSFKNKVENLLNREIETLTVGELRIYAKQFGVEMYANRIINLIMKSV